MPPDDGLRLDNRHGVQRRRKEAIEPDEEQSVRHRQLRPQRLALTTQHTQPMLQHHDLGLSGDEADYRMQWHMRRLRGREADASSDDI
jgi:hypothetical protein